MCSFQPQVLVGSVSDLRRLAELVQRRAMDLSSLDRAIFAVTRCGDQPVTDISRVVLWQTFGVPVYEIFVGPRGVLLAWECEAHDGWHVDPGTRFSVLKNEIMLDVPGRQPIPTGLTGSIDNETCPCGCPGTRLVNVEALALISFRRALAATA